MLEALGVRSPSNWQPTEAAIKAGLVRPCNYPNQYGPHEWHIAGITSLLPAPRRKAKRHKTIRADAPVEKASAVPVAAAPVSDKRQVQLDREAELKARMIAERQPPPCAAATEEHFEVAHWAAISRFKNVRRINAATKEEAKRDTRGIIPRGSQHISYQIAESAWQRIYARLRKKQKVEPHQASPKVAPLNGPTTANA
jgi:hypothetical protein